MRHYRMYCNEGAELIPDSFTVNEPDYYYYC